MTPLVIASSGAAVFAVLSIVLLFLILRSSNRPTVLRGSLRYREIRLGKAHAREHFDRDSLKMTFNVDMQADRKTLTIDAEGSAEDVQHVTGVLTDIFATNAAEVRAAVPPADDESATVRSRFTVVRTGRSHQVPALETKVDFAVLESGES
jgi:hypothetical protein